jgi:hypothetical protein
MTTIGTEAARGWRLPSLATLASRRGALALIVAALASYALQALAWPLERGRDSWDYWLWFLQALDRDPPVDALMPFRTPVTPLVTGAPMALGGARLSEIVLGLLYAATVVAWAWAVVPLGKRVAAAVGLLMLVNLPFAGLFHEVSSDAVFAALFAPWAGIVIRSLARPSRRNLVLLGIGVAALTLCRPTGQVAVVACLLVPLLALPAWRPRLTGVAVAVLAAVIPLGLWAVHNAVRYDDLTVARGGKAWVPFFRVAGSVDPANGDASRALARAVEREVLTQPPFAERDVDVETYFASASNFEVVRMIALSDRVFGWDADYDVLFDASVEAIRQEPWSYVSDVSDTVWTFLSQRYAPEHRVRPVPIPPQPAEVTVKGKPFPAPISMSPLTEAARYGFVWCPTDELRRCLVPDADRVFGSATAGERYREVTATIDDWNAQLPIRSSEAWLASKASTLSWRWPVSILWILLAAGALLVRRPRGTAAVLVLGTVAFLILLVHALSQSPQNEFALPVAPVWMVAAIVGLLAPAGRRSFRATSRAGAPPGAAVGTAPTRVDVIRAALAAVGGRSYLELGVKDGATFAAVDAPTRVAVDPAFTFRVPLGDWLRSRVLRARSGTLFFRMTSDAFFRGPGRRLGPFSVVFVDGLHTAEQSHRDIVNALSVLEDGGVVVVHDCNPESAAAAAPTLAEALSMPGHLHRWNGDVYRTIVRLRTRRDLRVVVVDVDEGVGLVARGANEAPLDLSEDEIDALTYADFAANRRQLLELVPPTDLDEVLAELAG